MIPLSLVPSSLVVPFTTKLSGVDGKELPTYGHIQTNFGVFSLCMEFFINFIVSNARPILGVDFLFNLKLILNMA